jgi:hypothetical protein
MSSLVTSGTKAGGFPREAGYTHGFAMLTVVAIVAAGAATLVPKTRRALTATGAETLPHGELGMVAAGTLVGDESE